MSEGDNGGKAGGWTPDVIIQAGKEMVAAILGLAVVGYTLWLAGASLSYASNDVQMGNAKDVLLLVLGLTGVVIGYYFGRIPADARAAQATREANAANAQAEQVAAAAGQAADKVDEILARSGANGAGGPSARGAGKQDGLEKEDEVRELRELRATLRALSRS